MGDTVKATYLWLDGNEPQQIRSKVRYFKRPEDDIRRIPDWSFDGSSTQQATTENSDLILKPVFQVDQDYYAHSTLVLCEVYNPDGTPHKTNYRHRLAQQMQQYKDLLPWVAVEQEFTLMRIDEYNRISGPLGFPANRLSPRSQGDYYCGNGPENIVGRGIIDALERELKQAEFPIAGTNAEVMPGQWEFQLGPGSPLSIADQLWVSRFFLLREVENYVDLDQDRFTVSFDPKPVPGPEWNGAGCHINMSTSEMRGPDGMSFIKRAIAKLGGRHAEHMAVYGDGNALRMTGECETASMDSFTFSVGGRHTSIRIPAAVAAEGCGYFEDRRPAANVDPYRAFSVLLDTVCGGTESA